MGWINHPACSNFRRYLVDRIRRPKYRFRNLRPVYFVCGGFESPRRDHLAVYLRKKLPRSLVFYADHAWEHLTRSRDDLNALEMEELFAQLSDCVLIVVESPGTFAEVGAFSLSARLRKKVLPIMDRKYRDAGSFLNTGPVRWIARESAYGGPVYADFASILTSVNEVVTKLESVEFRRTATVADLSSEPKYVQLMLADLVAICGPITHDEAASLLSEITEDRVSSGDVLFHLGLALALGYVESIEIDGADHYVRDLADAPTSFLSKKLFALEDERLKFIQSAQRIPAARSFMFRDVSL